MAKRWYVETTTTGERRFVSVKRSPPHGHHHHHHHHDHDCIKVGREEWAALVERERFLSDTNRGLVAENGSLKANLSAAEADVHQLRQVTIPQFQNQVASLIADNDSLRRTVDNAGQHSSKHYREEEKLREKTEKLEKETKELQDTNSDLHTRIECLSRQLDQSCSRRVNDLLRDLDYWKDQSRFWKGKFEDLQKRYDDTCDFLNRTKRKMEAYEDILKRRRII